MMGLFSLLVAMALPFTTPAFEVTVERDVPYATAMGYWTHAPVGDKKALGKLLLHTLDPKPVTLEMDIYTPAGDDTAERPLLLMMHGGSFLFGNKEEPGQTGWCQYFASLGYVAVSINYRLGFHARKKEFREAELRALEDADAALEYLLGREDLRIDRNRVFAAGTSAGAITALNVALTTNATCPAFVQEHNLTQKCGRLEDSGNSLKNKFKVKAIANMWGALYDLDVLKNKRIPIISFHGTEDHIVPYDEGYPFSSLKSNIGERLFDKMYGSKAIHERMNELHIHNQFFPIEGMGHSPYEDADGHLNHNYYFIQNKIQNFFLDILCGNCSVGYDKKNPTRFTLSNSNIAQTSWKVEGGFITESTPGEIQVLWRKNAPKHTVTASCLLKNGASSTKKITLKRSK